MKHCRSCVNNGNGSDCWKTEEKCSYKPVIPKVIECLKGYTNRDCWGEYDKGYCNGLKFALDILTEKDGN